MNGENGDVEIKKWIINTYFMAPQTKLKTVFFMNIKEMSLR